MFRRIRTILILTFAFTAAATNAVPANACPMCQQAVEAEEENKVPQAYMFSILFMMSMPAILLAAFSIGFYRLSKRAGEMAAVANATGTHHLTPQQPATDNGCF